MWDSIALWIIVLQGFFVAWFEYDVWRMNKDRFEERAAWRKQKQKQSAKKQDTTPLPPVNVSEG